MAGSSQQGDANDRNGTMPVERVAHWMGMPEPQPANNRFI